MVTLMNFEQDMINQISRSFSKYIGDDAANIPIDQHTSLAITKDLLIENVHFNTTYCFPADLAHKSLHVNLSDLAAVGATPKYILLGISLPTSYQHHIKSFLSAFSQCCHDQELQIIGGDTTQSTQNLAISITAIGTIKTQLFKKRSTAQPENCIATTGPIGHAHLGLVTLEKQIPGYQAYKQQLLRPTAKIAEGIWLAQQPGVTAMMDLSDGLWADLQKLSQASKLGAVLQIDNIPVDSLWLQACKNLQLDPINTQLIGGEDYGLLLTIDHKHQTSICQAFEKLFGYPLSIIGQITKDDGIIIKGNQNITINEITPYDHFQNFKKDRFN
jgi:thiamine-monophosphate kinase